jgi:hypothetical protein
VLWREAGLLLPGWKPWEVWTEIEKVDDFFVQNLLAMMQMGTSILGGHDKFRHKLEVVLKAGLPKSLKKFCRLRRGFGCDDSCERRSYCPNQWLIRRKRSWSDKRTF